MGFSHGDAHRWMLIGSFFPSEMFTWLEAGSTEGSSGQKHGKLGRLSDSQPHGLLGARKRLSSKRGTGKVYVFSKYLLQEQINRCSLATYQLCDLGKVI